MNNFNEMVSFIWSVADLLRGPYRPPQYKDVMLPMTVLRRLDCVLEPTKEKVLQRLALLKDSKIKDLEPVLNRVAEQNFHNTSEFTFDRLRDDPDNISAHLDSVPGVPGACDNAAGSATVLELARHFVQNPPRRTMVFAWFGTEELGLVGSFKYVEAHREELAKAVMMFNLDIGGGIIAQNFATVTGPEKLGNYVEAIGAEYGMALECQAKVASSDSTPFADVGIPTVGFSRSGGALSQYMHTSQDSLDYVDAAHLAMIGDFSLEFLRRMTGAMKFPFERTIPESLKDEMKRYKKNNLGMVVD